MSGRRKLAWRTSLAAVAVTLTIALAVSLVAGCGHPAAPPPPPPPPVSITRPMEKEVIEWDEYTGTLQSPETATVAARVSGFVEKADFKEGTIVHAGDLLFIIDPRPYQADLDNKIAAVAQAQSQADQAKVHYDRYAKVRGTQAISEDDYDAAKASYAQASSALAAARAATQTAQLNLEWTRVTAPINGRISRKFVTQGNLVNGGAGQATQLTTIVSLDPIYSYFNVPGRAYLKYHALSEQERRSGSARGDVPCFMELETEARFPHEGVVDFMDNQIDPGTGTMQIRGVFRNPNGELLPGLFARTRIPGSARYRTILIPDVAVMTDQAEKYLFVVVKDNVVERRTVELGAAFGPLRSIKTGVQLGEQVIVEGLTQAAPGRPVQPKEVPFPRNTDEDLSGIQSPTTRALPTSDPASQPAEAARATTQPAR